MSQNACTLSCGAGGAGAGRRAMCVRACCDRAGAHMALERCRLVAAPASQLLPHSYPLQLHVVAGCLLSPQAALQQLRPLLQLLRGGCRRGAGGSRCRRLPHGAALAALGCAPGSRCGAALGPRRRPGRLQRKGRQGAGSEQAVSGGTAAAARGTLRSVRRAWRPWKRWNCAWLAPPRRGASQSRWQQPPCSVLRPWAHRGLCLGRHGCREPQKATGSDKQGAHAQNEWHGEHNGCPARPLQPIGRACACTTRCTAHQRGA